MRIPFAIHRRIPVIRKQLEARDAALAENRCLRESLERANGKIETINRYFDSAGLKDIDSFVAAIDRPRCETSTSVAKTNGVAITDDYREAFRETLFATSYAWVTDDTKNDARVRYDMDSHIERRFRIFDEHVVPWLGRAADLEHMTVLEVGSGTGSSTLAFAPHVKRIVCHEIDQVSSKAARGRLDHFGIDNVVIRNELFDAGSDIMTAGEPVDLVLFCAVLEHMLPRELRSALTNAWHLLRPGGLLVVTDTPNRLALFDEHTSLLPFFSMLPSDLRFEYAALSPRADFAGSIAHSLDADRSERLTRWGAGISYHEFELTLGRSIHEHVVLDGYEREILSLMPDQVDDAVLRAAFHYYRIEASAAFTRHNLYFALRK